MAKNKKNTSKSKSTNNAKNNTNKVEEKVDKKLENKVDDKKEVKETSKEKAVTNKNGNKSEEKTVNKSNKSNNTNKSSNKSNNVNKSSNKVSQNSKSNTNKKVEDKKEKNGELSKEKTKEEEIVFKDVKTTKKSSNKFKETSAKNKVDNKVKDNPSKNKTENNVKEEKNTNKKEEKKVVNNINTEEFFEEKKKKKRKAVFIAFVTFIILVIILCFSTIFAILGSFKTTIARGVSINGVDISNLTYEEVKQKMIEVIEVQMAPEIELIYADYHYTVKLEDINYEYDLLTALEKAYNVGKTGNIIENNYSLIKTAILGEKINMNIAYDESSLDAIIDIIDTNIPGRVKQYSHYIEGSNLIINPGIDGVQVKTEELKTKILTSIQNRNYSNILKNYDAIQIEIPYENVVADKIDASKVAEEIFTEPQNAYYVEATETTDFEIYPAKDGVAFAITAEEAQTIIDSEVKNEYIIPLTITKAEIQLNDIGVEAFPYKIQTFSTSYDASNYSRSKNLEIAAGKINGTVLMPGEIFSFNTVVGERTVAEGYRNAKIYSNGQVVDGLAGGICQISSTLYNVVLLSNLEIIERYNHSFTTTYVAAGRDATVVYGIKDFKFKNSRNYPIKIEASVANGIATFSIYGIKEENEYTVKIIPKTTQTIPYTTQTIIDSTLAPGTMKVTQAGASGRKVTTYKETYLNGALVSSEIISNDVYQVMTRIVRANPAVEAPPVVAPETTPTVVPETNVTQ